MHPSSIRGLHPVVRDIEESREALLRRGVELGQVEDLGGMRYAGSCDPDGITLTLQEPPAAGDEYPRPRM